MAAALIGYYQNCQVSIQGLTMQYETLNGKQRTDISFELTGIDAECPELEGTVWLETPHDHVFESDAQEASMTVNLGTADVVNQKYQFSFDSDELTGDYFAHVSISPFGFECAMAIDEACLDEYVAYPCDAVLSGFRATPTINLEKGPAEEYFGADGM